ncbi:MAG: hypothetical protein MUC94_17300 [bacterium]|nr:hypothetical protein [bacterium]
MMSEEKPKNSSIENQNKSSKIRKSKMSKIKDQLRDPHFHYYAIWIVICILSIFFVSLFRIFPQPDFTLSIPEKKLSASRQSIIQSSITNKSINNYKHNVTLSADFLPPDLSIEFTAPFGKPIPTYATVMRIQVGPNASYGDHIIKVVGTGSDGKERYENITVSIVKKFSVDSTEIIK